MAEKSLPVRDLYEDLSGLRRTPQVEIRPMRREKGGSLGRTTIMTSDDAP